MKGLKRLIAIVGAGLVGLFLIVFGCKEFFETRSLKAGGKSAIAEVTDTEERFGRRGRRKYYLTANFKTENGETISTRARVSKSLYDEGADTHKVPVTYLPAKPSVNRFGAEVTTDFANIGLGVLMFGFAGFSIFSKGEG